MKASKKTGKDTQKEIREEIGRNIKRIRRSARGFLSAEKVAKKLEISRVSLTQIENGKKNINAVLLWELSCVLACDIKDFFPETPEGFQINEHDVQEIEKVDKRAVTWAEELFGKSTNKK